MTGFRYFSSSGSTGYGNCNTLQINPSYNGYFYPPYNPWSDLEKFLYQYDTPNFSGAYKKYSENFPNKSAEEMFIAAMRIGFSIAKLRENDKIIPDNNSLNSYNGINFTGYSYPLIYNTGTQIGYNIITSGSGIIWNSLMTVGT